MPPPTWVQILDTVISDTLSAIRPGLADNIYGTFPLTWHLMRKGKVVVRGGTDIRYRVLYAKNLTARSLGPGGTISLAPTEPVTTAIYEWKRVATNLTRLSMDDIKNRGDLAIANYVNDLVQTAQLSLMDLFEEMLFGAATGTDWNGLQDLVHATPTTSKKIGNINQLTYSWWRPQVQASSGIAATHLLPDTRHLYNTISKGRKDRAPDFGIMDQTSYELFEDEMAGLLILRDTAMVDAGFPQNFKFRGASMTFGDQCTAGYLYLLNSRYLELVMAEGGDFQTTDWKEPPNQVGDKVKQLYVDGQLCTNRRLVLGLETGISAT